MSDRPRSLLGRLASVIHGVFGGWVREREQRHPRAVYEQAILERTRHYAELKRAVAGILYMRNKVEAEISELRNELASTNEDIRTALRREDDPAALRLIGHKQGLQEELERAESEVDKLRAEAEDAVGNLTRFREEIRALEREKVRAIATLANARARRRIQDTLDGFQLEGEMRALQGVRDYVAQVRTEGRLEREIEDSGLEARIREIRRDTRAEAARRELDELKRRLRPAALAAESEVAARRAVPAGS